MGIAPFSRLVHGQNDMASTSTLGFIVEEEKREGNVGSHHRTSFMFQKKVLLFWFCVIITLDGKETGGLSTEFMESQSSSP